MKSLEQHIKDLISVCDCHVHLFGRNGIASYPKPYNSMFIMVENSLDHKDDDLLPYFDEFIKNGLPYQTHLLCVGKDAEETSTILDKYRDFFSGFGEVKCYKHYLDKDGKEHKHYDLSILNEVVNKGLPVFIHWDLDGEKDELLYNILKSNPETTFVLCHLGQNELDDKKHAFEKAVELQTEFPNLWLSISWVTLEYLVNNRKEISKIEIPDHVLVGTDFSTDMKLHNVDFNERYDLFRKIYNQFNVNANINKLLSI